MTRLRCEAATLAELMCADRVWLDAEFSAIMAANFPASPPAVRVASPGTGRSAHRSGLFPVDRRIRRAGADSLPARAWVRQRAPPAAEAERTCPSLPPVAVVARSRRRPKLRVSRQLQQDEPPGRSGGTTE